MIPARRGLAARFTLSGGEGKHAYYSIPVEAWSDDGGALVLLDEEGGLLTRADDDNNFVGIDATPCPEIVGLIPAGGWRVEYTDKAGEKEDSEPLVAWGLSIDGSTYPIVQEGDWGTTEVLEHNKDSNWRIVYPEPDVIKTVPGPRR